MSFQSPLAPEDDAHKKRFAAEWLRNLEAPIEAAEKIFPQPGDLGKRTYIACFWPSDPEVIEEKERLLAEHGELSFLPGRVELAKELWKIITNPFALKKDVIAASKEYRELMGFVVQTQTDNGSDDSDEDLPNEPTYKIVNE
jgi:hypothetical protein